MKETRIIIAGSRGFIDYDLLRDTLDSIVINLENVRIISGTARGADKLGEQYAHDENLKLTRMPADWDTYGKRAGYIRNSEMAKFAVEDGNDGILVAFWDGKSKGTKHMIDLAEKQGLKVDVVYF